MSTIHGTKHNIDPTLNTGGGSIAFNHFNSNNINEDSMRKKIDIFNPNASTAGYNQVSTWTMT